LEKIPNPTLVPSSFVPVLSPQLSCTVPNYTISFTRSRTISVCRRHYIPSIWITHSKHSVNICWMNITSFQQPWMTFFSSEIQSSSLLLVLMTLSPYCISSHLTLSCSSCYSPTKGCDFLEIRPRTHSFF
jgi:hypothetical protein